jgi:hypothetical protein
MAESERNPLDKVSDSFSGWWDSFGRLRKRVGTPVATLLLLLVVSAMVWWNWEDIAKRPGVGWIIEHLGMQSGQQIDKENLLRNGGFEEDLKFWSTGYYETDVYHGSLGFWASRVGTIGAMKIADVRGDIDSDIYKSGSPSFKITNNSPLEAHIYGSMSQRITGLLKNSDYIASFWVKAERASKGTLEITTDLNWFNRTSIEPGTYNWKEFSHVFSTGSNTFVDFRIISEEPGTVWVDDIAFRRYYRLGNAPVSDGEKIPQASDLNGSVLIQVVRTQTS